MENPKDELESRELAKKAAGCPTPYETRLILGITTDQFCKLLEISKQEYFKWVSGEKQPSIHQKIFLEEAIRVAREKKLI